MKVNKDKLNAFKYIKGRKIMDRELLANGNIKNNKLSPRDELITNWVSVLFDENTYQCFLDFLLSIADEKYKEFSNKLIPQVNNILGIRLPYLQRIAKQIAKGDYKGFLSYRNIQYFEEIMVRGYVIGNISNQSIEEIKEMIHHHVLKLDNWSTCDSFCSSLKIAKKYPNEIFELILPYANSKECYEIRFFIVMCLNYYIEDEHISLVDEVLQSISSEEYYVNMAICWAYTVIFQYDSNRVYQYLKKLKQELEIEQNCRKRFLLRKTISKICDSRKITEEEKAIVRSYHV